MHRGGVMDAAPATASLLLAHRRYLRFRAERGRILARPSRWLPFADGSSNDMLDPERFLPQLSSETFLGEFMAASSSPTVRRRQLATELKRLRLAAKMTIEQVAEHHRVDDRPPEGDSGPSGDIAHLHCLVATLGRQVACGGDDPLAARRLVAGPLRLGRRLRQRARSSR